MTDQLELTLEKLLELHSSIQPLPRLYARPADVARAERLLGKKYDGTLLDLATRVEEREHVPAGKLLVVGPRHLACYDLVTGEGWSYDA